MSGDEYAINGEFGQVRLCRSCITPSSPVPFHLLDGGWHRCRDLYRIHRPQGTAGSLLFFSLSAGGRLRIGDGECMEIPAFSVCILPSRVAHEYFTAPGQWWEFYWLHLSEDCSSVPEQLAREQGYVLPLHRIPQMAALIENLFPERFTGDDLFYSLTASHTVSQILHLVLEDAFGGKIASRGSGTVQRIIARIESDYHRKLSMEVLARENYLSEQHMIRIFRNATGCTPYEYLKKYRLQKAKQLLIYTELPLAEIALQTGFSGVNNFICQFRREWGVPPGQYRQLHR